MKRFVLIPLTLWLCLLLGLPTVFSADLDPKIVNRAIDRAVSYLKRQQKANGSWDENNVDWKVGITSLCTLALLSSGADKNDPVVARALAFLRSEKLAGIMQMTYSVSLRSMVYALADPERDRALLRENVAWLERTQVKTGPNTGGWGYGLSVSDYADMSNTQFAILALYEAERVGVGCQPDVWKLAQTYLETRQNTDGSWGYTSSESSGRGSMTCSGIASTLIVAGMREKGGAQVRGGRILCCQDTDSGSETQVQRGMNWLARHFDVSSNPRYGGWLYYYLYSLERVGRLSGVRLIGNRDWYREGIDSLLNLKGDLVDSWRGRGFEGDLVATSFAVLFLTKGRRPILLSKIHYGEDNSWNVHPQDVGNLTQFVEKQWKQDLTWQTINWEWGSVEDLLQSPVLYLCGTENPLPDDPVKAEKIIEKLRGYLDMGGFLFAESFSSNSDFDRGFRELMQRVLPGEEYTLRLLEEDHPIWTAELPVPVDQLRPLEGIDFGCRTSVIYCPGLPLTSQVSPNKPISVDQFRPSLSCLWEIAQLVDRGHPYAKNIQEQINAGLAIGCNILAYATNRELLTKLERQESVSLTSTKRLQDRGTITVGLLEHGGGSHCAPRAIPRLMETAALKFGVPVSAKVKNVRLTDLNLFDYPLLFIHGRSSFRFSDEERTAIKEYVRWGGFLFVNSICASPSFTQSFEEEMKKIFPENPLLPIPKDDPIFSDLYNGFTVEKVTLRVPQKGTNQKLEIVQREVEPDLRGIRVDDRWAIVFSPYDVSCALEKMNSISCKGYSQESALKIGINVLLYALEHL
ncbi:MAG: DUF4159 domain-containing protein [Thermoguttaceae bacterium]